MEKGFIPSPKTNPVDNTSWFRNHPNIWLVTTRLLVGVMGSGDTDTASANTAWRTAL